MGMELQAVARRSASDEVFDQIAGNIVRGDAAAGSSLLSERRLAEVLGVSRPVVREALQRLAHAGLVEVRQGGLTTVRDFKRHAGLNVLAQLLLPGGMLDLSVARSVVETRLFVGPQIAALAAQRAGPRLGRPLSEVADLLAGEEDPIRSQRHALAFWEHLVDGADSIVLRLMFNSLRSAYEPVLDALAPVMGSETDRDGAYRGLIDAVKRRNAEGARRAAHDLLTPTTNLLLDAISRLEAHHEPDAAGVRAPRSPAPRDAAERRTASKRRPAAGRQ
jgi:GntR family transcriptional regulator, transcriptional repressor for pyruvate dehydrogenase complex